MTILEQVDAYRGLLDQKERLVDATKENNKALEEARNALAQAMIDEEARRSSGSVTATRSP